MSSNIDLYPNDLRMPNNERLSGGIQRISNILENYCSTSYCSISLCSISYYSNEAELYAECIIDYGYNPYNTPVSCLGANMEFKSPSNRLFAASMNIGLIGNNLINYGTLHYCSYHNYEVAFNIATNDYYNYQQFPTVAVGFNKEEADCGYDQLLSEGDMFSIDRNDREYINFYNYNHTYGDLDYSCTINIEKYNTYLLYSKFRLGSSSSSPSSTPSMVKIKIDMGTFFINTDNRLSNDKIFEKIKEVLKKNESSFFNTSASSTHGDKVYSTIGSYPTSYYPNISKRSLFDSSLIVDFPFFYKNGGNYDEKEGPLRPIRFAKHYSTYMYSDFHDHGNDNYSTFYRNEFYAYLNLYQFMKYNYLGYCSFDYSNYYCSVIDDTTYSSFYSFNDWYEIIENIYGYNRYNNSSFNTYYSIITRDRTRRPFKDIVYESGTKITLNDDNIVINPVKNGPEVIKLGFMGVPYFDGTNTIETDFEVYIRYDVISDFEPIEKNISIEVLEDFSLDMNADYGDNIAAIEVRSDNPLISVTKDEHNIFIINAKKSGYYELKQYVNGKEKTNKIKVTVNCNYNEININTITNSYYRLDMSDYLSIPASYINFDYDGSKVNVENIGEYLYLIKVLTIDPVRIRYYSSDVDFEYINITSTENTIEIPRDKFITISKNQNRRIVSNFEEFKKYSTVVSNDKAYMIMGWDDFKIKHVLKSLKSKRFSSDATLTVYNNRITFEYGSEIIYKSSNAENGKTIFIKISNSNNSDIVYDKVILFDKVLTEEYVDRKEETIIKSNYKTVDLLDFDKKAIYSDKITNNSINNVNIEIFYLNNEEKVQMWEINSPISGNIYAFNNKEDFSINSVQDSIDKLGCSFYKENGVFGLYIKDNSLINSIEVELDDDKINPFVVENLKNNGKKIIIANSENHKSVYSKLVYKNKKYTITDLSKPSNFKVYSYDKYENKVGEFTIVSNGFGDYKVLESNLISKNDIETTDKIYQFEYNGGKFLYPFEVNITTIRSRLSDSADIIITKSENVADIIIEKIPNSRLVITEIGRKDDTISLNVKPADTNSDVVETFKLKCFDYELDIDVEFRNIDYKHKPTNKSELQNLLFNTTPKPNLWEIDTSLVTDMSSLFSGKSSYDFTGIEYWDVSNVTNMNSMFNGCSKFNKYINNWDVSNVTNMYQMFYNCSSFNQPLNNWNVSNVTSMARMFYNNRFNQPLNNWDVSSVKNMDDMFYNSTFNQPLNNWNVSNVTSMARMFYNSPFNQPLDKWDVSSVTNMNNMFYNCSSFNQPLNNWNVSSVTIMEAMFRGAILFNQPLNNWNVSNVTDMDYMFYGCLNFNKDISLWNILNNCSYNNIFYNCPIQEKFKPNKFK